MMEMHDDVHGIFFKILAYLGLGLGLVIRSVCGYGTVSVVENATGTVPYSKRNRNGIR